MGSVTVVEVTSLTGFDAGTALDPEIILNPGETQILNFDVNIKSQSGSLSDSGVYSASAEGQFLSGVDPVANIGSFTSFDTSTGIGTWEITQAEWVAAGSPEEIRLHFSNSGSGITSTARDIDVSLCFAAGSLIATPAGEVAVETLKIGDVIRTADGGDVAVKWMGVQKVSTIFTPPERLRLIRFAAGSLGNGLPHSDLTVTTDHAMLVDGVLCNASALVNGATITRVPLAEMGADYTVFHIETEAHEIILANGAPAETFIDNVSRRVFDNYAEYQALYGEETEMQELPLPRATSARQLPASLRQTRVA